jgi:hypothetical protein
VAENPIKFESITAGEVELGDTVSAFGFIGQIRAIEDAPGSPGEVILRFRNESAPLRLDRRAPIQLLKRARA